MTALKKAIGSLMCAAMLFALAGPAVAAFPEKPIKLIIPFRAGGGSDGLARRIQVAVEKYKLLPQPLVVVNMEGAGGTIATRHVKDAKPDGYTIMQIHQEMFAVAATGRVEFGPEAFEPIIQTTRSCLYLAVGGDSPFKTFADLVAYGTANPNKLKMGDIIGGVSHFPAVMLMSATGAKFGIVQIGGTAKRFAAIKGGHTQLSFFSPGWIRRGGDQLRGLLWLGPERHPAAPNMPTALELGYNVSACLNRRYWAPKGTPADRVRFIADAFEKAVRTPELVDYHKKRMSEIVVRRGEQLITDVKEEYAKFIAASSLVKASMGR